MTQSPPDHQVGQPALPYLTYQATQTRTMMWLRAGIVLALLLPTLCFVALSAVRYHQIEAEHQRYLDRVARVVSEHALKLFDTNQVLLERILDLVSTDSDAEIRQREAALHQKLRAMVDRLPQVQSVWVMNASGNPLVTNRFLPAPADLDVSDRESFVAHRNGERGTYVTGALIGRKTKDLFFDLTRRRDLADGTFAGTVQVSLYPKYLVDFYREMAANETEMAIALLRNDGALIARWPEPTTPARKISPNASIMGPMRSNTQEGNMRSISTVDGIERFGAYRRVGDYPVYAYVGFSVNAVQAAWRREVGILAAFVFPIALALAGAGWVALRNTRRTVAIAARLQEETRQRQKIEDVLRHTQKMEALGHLTGGVAHDFNNLLMIVEMNAQLLRLSGPDAADLPRLEAIERAVGNGTRLTRQLLSFSRRQPLLPRTILLQETLPSLTELCRAVLGSRVSLDVKVAPDVAPIRIDLHELELALINLAVNARHAMADQGTLSVDVRMVASDRGAREVEIAVGDTGTGMPPEIVERVFEPFFTTKKANEGTGLGLSQVYGMCTAAGGSVSIDSAPGRGTTVRMRFPPQVPDGEGDQMDAGREGPVRYQRVLVVEDNPEIGHALSDALRHLGCTVRHCGNGDEALRHLEEHSPDYELVVSDVVMPGSTDGIALARHVRKRYPRMKIVLMTGYTQQLPDAESLGLEVYPKPLDLAALRSILGANPGS